MLVAVEQIFDVGQLEAELADVVGDEVRVLFGPAVDQDVACRIGDQNRRNPARADQIGVAEDSDRRRGLGVIVPGLARVRELGSGDLDRRARLVDQPGPAERDDDLLRREREEQASERSSPRSRRRLCLSTRRAHRPTSSG
jgi:hypothetical protein